MFTTLNDIHGQLPFFCCDNQILDEKCQDDIAMYVYCNETKTPAFSGSYSETPAIWIEKYFIIQKAIEIRNKQLTEKVKNA